MTASDDPEDRWEHAIAMLTQIDPIRFGAAHLRLGLYDIRFADHAGVVAVARQLQEAIERSHVLVQQPRLDVYGA